MAGMVGSEDFGLTESITDLRRELPKSFENGSKTLFLPEKLEILTDLIILLGF